MPGERAGGHGERVFISIGSNTGERESNCERAVAALAAEDGIEVVAESPLYETDPWGNTSQGAFVNCAVEVRTTLSPLELIARFKEMERRLGRVPTYRWGPRLIDLDIVFYGDRVVDEEGLRVPHPHAGERAFVLVPMSDIAPDFRDPATGRTVSGMLAALRSAAPDDDGLGVRRVSGGKP